MGQDLGKNTFPDFAMKELFGISERKYVFFRRFRRLYCSRVYVTAAENPFGKAEIKEDRRDYISIYTW